MSDKELNKRLRDFEKVTVGDARDAADRIEQLVATNEALTAKVKLMDDLDAINGEKIEALTAELNTVMDNTVAELEAKLAECEARLGKAEAGLLAIAKRDEQMIWGEDYEVEEAFKDMRDIALATLAAVTETHKIKSSKAAPPYGLEGESHE